MKSLVENSRKEAEDHYYNPAHTGLLDLGLKPRFLTDEVLSKIIESGYPESSSYPKTNCGSGF